MFELALGVSIMITAIWGMMKSGNFLYPLRWLIDSIIEWLPPKIFLYVRKPLYDCLFCMSSIWGIVFTFWWDIGLIEHCLLLLKIAGINYLIQRMVDDDEAKVR